MLTLLSLALAVPRANPPLVPTPDEPDLSTVDGRRVLSRSTEDTVLVTDGCVRVARHLRCSVGLGYRRAGPSIEVDPTTVEVVATTWQGLRRVVHPLTALDVGQLRHALLPAGPHRLQLSPADDAEAIRARFAAIPRDGAPHPLPKGALASGELVAGELWIPAPDDVVMVELSVRLGDDLHFVFLGDPTALDDRCSLIDPGPSSQVLGWMPIAPYSARTPAGRLLVFDEPHPVYARRDAAPSDAMCRLHPGARQALPMPSEVEYVGEEPWVPVHTWPQRPDCADIPAFDGWFDAGTVVPRVGSTWPVDTTTPIWTSPPGGTPDRDAVVCYLFGGEELQVDAVQVVKQPGRGKVRWVRARMAP